MVDRWYFFICGKASLYVCGSLLQKEGYRRKRTRLNISFFRTQVKYQPKRGPENTRDDSIREMSRLKGYKYSFRFRTSLIYIRAVGEDESYMYSHMVEFLLPNKSFQFIGVGCRYLGNFSGIPIYFISYWLG